jgi:hypothetical protein
VPQAPQQSAHSQMGQPPLLKPTATGAKGTAAIAAQSTRLVITESPYQEKAKLKTPCRNTRHRRSSPSHSMHYGTEEGSIFSSATPRKECGEADMESSRRRRVRRDSTPRTTAMNLPWPTHDTRRRTVADHVRPFLQQLRRNHAEPAPGNDTAGSGLLRHAAGRSANSGSTHSARSTECLRNPTVRPEPSSMDVHRRRRQTQKSTGR